MFGGVFGSLVHFGIAVGFAAALGLGVYIMSLLPTLPSVTSVSDLDLQVPLRVFTAEGDLIAEYGDERRFPLSIDDVPETLVDAILASEDDDFYHHLGIDIRGIARAALANLRAGGASQGASTITMQVARNYFLTPEKTYQRKLKEVLLALRLEGALSKQQILELYLNKIFLGHRAYGFAAAAKVYYDEPLAALDLAQIAMLAGLPKAPSRDNPISNPANAEKRRNYVLGRMLAQGMIDDQAYAEAKAQPISAQRYVAKVEFDAPYMAEMVRQYMIQHYGDTAYSGGYSVFTTIRKDFQRAADKALRKGIIDYDQRHGYRGPVGYVAPDVVADEAALLAALDEHPTSSDIVPAVVMAVNENSLDVRSKQSMHTIEFDQLSWAREFKHARSKGPEIKRASDVAATGDVVYIMPVADADTGKAAGGQWRLAQLPEVSGALVSIDPNSGAILALSGGFDYYLSKFNRATQAKRQPGSNLKPFIYSAAIDKGFTAASLVSGAPVVVTDEEFGDEWRPENYSGKFFGPTRIRKALSLSLNLVSIRLLRAIGPDYARTYLERFGFNRNQLPKGLSLALGTASATPVQMAKAYSVFANGGYRVEPFFIARIEDRNKEIVEENIMPVFCDRCNPNQPAAPQNAEVDENTSATGSDTEQTHGERPAQAPRMAPRVLDKETAFVMRSIMTQVVQTGTARAAKSLGRSDIAGKTGTTNDYRDAWFSGFSPDLVTTVWIGFDTPTDLGRSEAGSKAALPIWITYNREALPNFPERPLVPPEGIVSTRIHKDTGEPVAENDPNGIKEYFIEGTQPDGAIALRTQHSSQTAVDRSAAQASNPSRNPSITPTPLDTKRPSAASGDSNTESLF